MKRKQKGGILRKTAAAGLALSLILSGAWFAPASGGLAQAAEQTVPKNENGDVFAGLYTDGSYTTPYETAAEDAVKKFVTADVLSVGCQVTPKTDDMKKSALRFVTTVDTLIYREVGFIITMENGGNAKTIKVGSDTVYTNIVVAEGDDNPAYTVAPTVFSEKSQFFATYTIKNIPESAFDNNFIVTPYWVTVDGITVKGVTRGVRVNDAYGERMVVNVPVRLNSDEEIAAGLLEVTYDTEKFKYIVEDGYIAGDILEEVGTAEVVSGTVRCVGNVAVIDNGKAADGMYINLRFEYIGDSVQLPEAEFMVQNTEFCDKEENTVPDTGSLSVVEARYNNFVDKVSD